MRVSSAYWAEPVLATYREAVRSFQDNHPGTPRPHFWELLQFVAVEFSGVPCVLSHFRNGLRVE